MDAMTGVVVSTASLGFTRCGNLERWWDHNRLWNRLWGAPGIMDGLHGADLACLIGFHDES